MLFLSCIVVVLCMISSCDDFKAKVSICDVDGNGRSSYSFTKDRKEAAENCLTASYGVVKTIIATEDKEHASSPNSRTVDAIKLYNQNVQNFNNFYNEHKQFIKIEDWQITQYACAP